MGRTTVNSMESVNPDVRVRRKRSNADFSLHYSRMFIDTVYRRSASISSPVQLRSSPPKKREKRSASFSVSSVTTPNILMEKMSGSRETPERPLYSTLTPNNPASREESLERPAPAQTSTSGIAAAIYAAVRPPKPTRPATNIVRQERPKPKRPVWSRSPTKSAALNSQWRVFADD